MNERYFHVQKDHEYSRKYSDEDGYVARFFIRLSEKRGLLQRKSNTIMNYLGEIGGFFSAISMIVYYLLYWYQDSAMKSYLASKLVKIRPPFSDEYNKEAHYEGMPTSQEVLEKI